MACGPSRAAVAYGTRPERTPVVRPGPARPAAAAADGICASQERTHAPSPREGARGAAEVAALTTTEGRRGYPGKRLGEQRLGLHRLFRRASAPTRAPRAHGTRPERNLVARPGPARPAASAHGASDDDKLTERPPAHHEGVRGSAEDTTAMAKEGPEKDPGKRLGEQRLGAHHRHRTASAPPRAPGAYGMRLERTLVSWTGPARPAAVATVGIDGRQETKQPPPSRKGVRGPAEEATA
jgi:hypothetical protein